MDVDDFVDDGEDDEGRRGMDVELLADVAAVGGDGVERQAELVGNFFVRQPVGHTGDNLLLPVAQCLGNGRGRCRNLLLLPPRVKHLPLQSLHIREQHSVFYLAVGDQL